MDLRQKDSRPGLGKTGVEWQAYHPDEAWFEYANAARLLWTLYGVIRGPKAQSIWEPDAC